MSIRDIYFSLFIVSDAFNHNVVNLHKFSNRHGLKQNRLAQSLTLILTLCVFSLDAQYSVIHNYGLTGQAKILNGKIVLPTYNGIYISDGTANGTSLVIGSTSLGGSGAYPENSVIINGKMLFTTNASNANSLWSTDGTTNGTTVLTALALHGGVVDSYGLFQIRSGVFSLYNLGLFQTSDGNIWKTDGTVLGTSVFSSSSIDAFNKSNLVFNNNCLLGGSLTDGTNISSGYSAYFSSVLTARASGSNLFAYGTSKPIYGSKTGVFVSGDGVNFVNIMVTGLGSSNSTRYNLYDDGVGNVFFEKGGTVFYATGGVVTSLSNFPNYTGGVGINGKFYFITYDNNLHKNQLWISDGTTPGTIKLADIGNFTSVSNPADLEAIRLNSVDYISYWAGTSQGGGVWKTDGTPSGTSKFFDVSFTNSPFIYNNNLYVSSSVGVIKLAPQNQTINFNSLPAYSYGDAPFQLTATASSGLPISYTSSNTAVATVSGSTVTIVGIGTTNITASQVGDANYNAAANVIQPLTVVGPILSVVQGSTTTANSGTYDFGNVFMLNNSGDITFSVKNIGNATLTINLAGSTLTGANASDFTIDVASLNSPIPANNSLPAKIRFTPSAPGLRNATISIASDDPVQNPYIINLQGAGVKQNQTITFGALATKLNTDAPFSLMATSSSGLPVSYNSSNTSVATISGGSVTIIGAGTTVITAGQVGDTNYNSATDVPQTLTVKISQTINFNGLTAKTFGDAPFVLTATASSTLAVDYSSSNTAVAMVSGNTVTIVGAGTSTITAIQVGDATFNPATSVPQTLTVNKASQTITFNVLTTKTFGDAPFALTATGGSSGQAITFVSSNSNVATVSGNMVAVVGAGTTIITARQAGNTNYNAAADVPQTLTVNKGNQSISFNALSAKTFGDASFPLLATGGSSGQPVTFLSSNISVGTISGNMLTIVGAGTTTITASQAGDLNYDGATDVLQTLTVNKANQTITFDPLVTKSANDGPFTLAAIGGGSGQSITFVSSNIAVATVTGNTVAIVGAGTTTITASQAGDANYNPATDVPQVLTVVVKQDQTITFNAIGDKTVSDPAFSLTATASSGLTINYAASSSKVTISGNGVTIIHAGRETITANQQGDAAFNSAPSVNQSFCINPVKPTITISNSNTEAPTLTSSASIGNQWFLNDTVISGATNTILSVTSEGVYKVQAQADDCVSSFSNDFPIIVTGDLSFFPEHISFYPNPSRDFLFIKGISREVGDSFVTDNVGRSTFIKLEKLQDRLRADVSTLSGGMYVLTVSEGNEVHRLKFVKQ